MKTSGPEKQRMGTLEKITSWATIILAVATICLAISTQILVNESKDSNHKQLRAYLAISAPIPDTSNGKHWFDGQCWHFLHEEENVGNTPAWVVGASKHLEVLPRDSVPDPRTLTIKPVPVLFASQIPIPYHDTICFDPKQTDFCVQHRLYYYGLILYTDVYRKEQWITFCYEYMCGSQRFEAYRQYNDQSRE